MDNKTKMETSLLVTPWLVKHSHWTSNASITSIKPQETEICFHKTARTSLL